MMILQALGSRLMGDTPWVGAVHPGDTEAYGLKNQLCLASAGFLSVVCVHPLFWFLSAAIDTVAMH